MATNLISLRPLNFSVNSHTHTRPKNGRKPSSSSSLSSSSWWTPLFGWSSDPDYITEGNKTTNADDSSSSFSDERIKAKPPSSSLSSKPKFAPGCFTEDKARMLRMMTSDLESSSHDMYHSAIASRLATDIPNRLNSSLKSPLA